MQHICRDGKLLDDLENRFSYKNDSNLTAEKNNKTFYMYIFNADKNVFFIHLHNF